MYEHMRNDFLAALFEIVRSNTETERIISALDKIAENYDISEKTTALMVREDVIPALVKTYLASRRIEGLSINTIKLYGFMLKDFFVAVSKQPEDVTTNDIRLYLMNRKGKIADRSLEKCRQIINCFFTWATDEEYLVKNPCRTIKAIKFEAKPRRALTRLQLEKLRRICKTKRDKALIDVMYSTGCRVSEVVNMRKSDIDYGNRSIDIIGKGSKHNTVYLNTNAQLSLEDYLSSRTDQSDYLFVGERAPHDKIDRRTVEHLFKKFSQEAGFYVTPHIIRHTTATLSLQSGMKITEVQKLLGHATVSTTQIYAETLQTDVKNAHEKYVI